MKLEITWPEGRYVANIEFSEAPAGRHRLPRTIFSRCVGLAPKLKASTPPDSISSPELSRVVLGGGPGCGMAQESSIRTC